RPGSYDARAGSTNDESRYDREPYPERKETTPVAPSSGALPDVPRPVYAGAAGLHAKPDYGDSGPANRDHDSARALDARRPGSSGQSHAPPGDFRSPAEGIGQCQRCDKSCAEGRRGQNGSGTVPRAVSLESDGPGCGPARQ